MTTQFKVGDTVKRIGGDFYPLKQGYCYVVSEVRGPSIYLVGHTSGYTAEKFALVKAKAPPQDKTQVGGDHYTKMAIQPYEYAHKNKLGYLESNVVKYVSRHGDKNGKEDLLKAIHSLQVLIELQYPGS